MKTLLFEFKNQAITFTSAMIFLFILALSCDSGPPKNSRAAQAMRGKELFKEQCASCHGAEDMTATQAVLDTLETVPPDLVRINKRRGVKDFPVAEIARIIDGRNLVGAHGTREMPVWGQVYEEGGMVEGEIKGKKGELIAYLMSIQKMD
jgi:mono/diheme cytochrome c family protein